MGCAALACCAELVPTNQGSRPPAAHVSARRPIPAREFTQALDIQSLPIGAVRRRGPKQLSITGLLAALFLDCSCRCCDFPLLSPASRGNMVQRVATVAFEGIEARAVDVQV